MPSSTQQVGIIYGVGVGPGDPNLLTLQAVAVLQQVSAVLVPRSKEDRDSLALSIAQPHLPATCEVLEAVFPMTERREILEAAWREAAELLLKRIETGQSVAFLTLGDAMLYSTWSYLLATITQMCPGVPTVTVPGITAMSACAAAVNRPLAEGRAPLLVWPGEPPADLAPLLDIAPNVVFMKAARHLEPLAQAVDEGQVTATAIRRCCLPGQAITDDLRAWIGEHEYFTTVLAREKEEA
ncbi:MAG: precorrin-2 C(20)-methyltransferase [Armatimonadota bacterium]